MEGTESQNHSSGRRGTLGGTVVESNGGERGLAQVFDNETHEGVCWLHD